MECLTGGFTERYVGLDGPCFPMKRGVDPKLFEKISEVIEGGGLVCAGTLIDNMDMGIFGGHAYSITGTHSVPYKGKLVNLVKVRTNHNLFCKMPNFKIL